ncbi:MAG TPA: hypothetical protein VK171_16525 [Fimbriimonas sp.]|nr:hypothetical protein [Fimbriimonas sp.]
MEIADSSRKLSYYDPASGWVPLRYADTFVRQNISGVSRLLIASSSNSVDLLSELISFYSGPFQLVYLLVTPPEDQEPARFEVSDVSAETLIGFLSEFREFLSTDGRHHVWIHSSAGGTLILDEHDWIYAYGSLDALSGFLTERGFGEGMPELPYPHIHHEREELDGELDRLLGAFDWKASKLS